LQVRSIAGSAFENFLPDFSRRRLAAAVRGRARCCSSPEQAATQRMRLATLAAAAGQGRIGR
jgi:hypothetical protein